MGKSIVEKEIRKEATTVLVRVVLFLCYYVMLILIGVALFAGAFWVTTKSLILLDMLSQLNGRLVIVGIVLFAAMWWFCFQIGVYLVKPLFDIQEDDGDGNRIEVTEEDCPQLFASIRKVAKATGNDMPRCVYLSAEVNACVFYEKTSIWSIFFPPRKSLMVGCGLLNGMNVSEVEAVLAHEFGHFSQQTMRIGTISYRLMIMIRTMVEYTEERQREHEMAKMQEDYKWYFHLADGLISKITRLTMRFHKWIEWEYRKLSRYMEFEADGVACSIVGARAMISSLCKIQIMSTRLENYEKVVGIMLHEGKRIEDFWKGFAQIDEYLATDEQTYFNCNTMLSGPIGDAYKFPSKVVIKDSWNTHPSLEERVENARQRMGSDEKTDFTDARGMVGEEAWSEIGSLHIHYIANNMEQPVKVDSLDVMNMSEFGEWLQNTMEKYYQPSFIYAFTRKRIMMNIFPTDEQMAEKADITYPFTEYNRNIIIEYSQAYNDLQTLTQISKGGIATTDFTYNGKDYANIDIPLTLQKEYVQKLTNRSTDIDCEIFIWLWKNATDKDHIKTTYYTILYTQDKLDDMTAIYDKACELRQELEDYQSHGANVTVNQELISVLTQELWKIMRTFQYDILDDLCGDWTDSQNVLVRHKLREWKKFAEQDKPQDINFFYLVEDAWQLHHHLYSMADKDWQDMVVQAYKEHEKKQKLD